MQSHQEVLINNLGSFELNHIFDCGQCFRWNKQEDWSYIWVFWNNILNVQKKSDWVLFKWIVAWDIKEIVTKYFDLDRDYEGIKSKLSKADNYMKESIEYGQWIRLLNQDLWETIISFII